MLLKGQGKCRINLSSDRWNKIDKYNDRVDMFYLIHHHKYWLYIGIDHYLKLIFHKLKGLGRKCSPNYYFHLDILSKNGDKPDRMNQKLHHHNNQGDMGKCHRLTSYLDDLYWLKEDYLINLRIFDIFII